MEVQLLNDRTLVEQALSGSQDAYAQLYKMLLPFGRGVGYNVLRNIDLSAEEFAHDAVAKVLMNLKSFNHGCKLTTWAVSIIRNEALEKLRRGNAKIRSGEMIYLDAPVDGKPFDVDSGIDTERYALAKSDLRNILGKLKPRDRAMAIDFWMMGFTSGEMAKKYGLSESGARATMSRLRAKSKRGKQDERLVRRSRGNRQHAKGLSAL